MAKAIKSAPAFMDKASAFKLADSIARRGTVLDTDIQRAAVSAICYSIIHRDSTIGTKLYDCFPKGNRKDSFVAYLEQHGNFFYEKETKAFGFRDNDCSEDMGVLIPALAANHWTVAKKEVIKSIFVVEDYLETVAKKLEKQGFPDLANEVRGTRNGYIVAEIGGLFEVPANDEPAKLQAVA